MKPIDPNTDYKALFNSMFLNESDFPNDTICEITGVFSEKAVERGSPDMTVVTLKNIETGKAYNKPVKLCNEMMDILYTFTKERATGSWVGVPVTVFIRHGLKAFGGIHNVPRFRKIKPTMPTAQSWMSPEQFEFISANMSAEDQAEYCKNNNLEGINHVLSDDAKTLIDHLKKQMESK